MNEIVWLFLASALAGIGTGLAGLSAATVMVPILITLCPSFAGETGAYQATAVALASDILGSAVTSYTYHKHGNIDLKRGGVMCACILVMCTLGSYAAWLAGNVVLGAFTLFLTFCIGIRFLVKPDSEQRKGILKGGKLNAKEIAISMFFGLTIGFGTGFFGTGGGMMMLVVFTVFLGMDQKVAVGTSTFIMTFTALIASVSHILIHPAILTDCLQPLLICMAVATLFSLVSARFANRVRGKIVGLVTGMVLSILGLAMIVLHYQEYLFPLTWFQDILPCAVHYLRFIIPTAAFLVVLHFALHFSHEGFRKALHTAAFLSPVVIVIDADCWQSAAAVCLLFALIIYPLLALAEEFPWFDGLFVQRSRGEIKESLLFLFVGTAFRIFLSWGLFGRPEIEIAAVLMWGSGDMAAALIGKKYGKHKLNWPFVDPKKSYEGSLANFLFGLVFGTAALKLCGAGSFLFCFLSAFISALVGMYVEAVSKAGHDTVTVPLAETFILMVCFFLKGL
ncbi:MAG: TSUP family transporter [Erysipelotrichaceae bacterium]|nr:TSUP family transporter [Erysipelotrichaceae bacterium]